MGLEATRVIALYGMLSRAQVSEFFASGFLTLPGFFGSESVALMRAAFSRLERRAQRLGSTESVDGSLFVVEPAQDGSVKIERVVWCGAAEPALAVLGRTAPLLRVMGRLLGSPVVDQLINQAHIKVPGDGVHFPFHQDSYHRRYGTRWFSDVNGQGSFVQSLTAVDAMAPDNGGLWVVPHSHLGGHIETADGRLPEHAFDRSAAIPMRLEPGDLMLLSPFTIHGSGPNAGTTRRRVFINGFASPSANQRDYPGCGVGLRLNVPEADDRAPLVPADRAPAMAPTSLTSRT